MLCLGIIYHLAARLGLQIVHVQPNTSPVWPPTGIAIAALLLFGIKYWPGIALGVILGYLFNNALNISSGVEPSEPSQRQELGYRNSHVWFTTRVKGFLMPSERVGVSDAVSGLMTLPALDILEKDHSMKVIAILSKPPGVKTLATMVERIKTFQMPVICCFLGIQQAVNGEGKYFRRAKTIDEAVQLAIQAIGGQTSTVIQSARPGRKAIGKKQKYLRGVCRGYFLLSVAANLTRSRHPGLFQCTSRQKAYLKPSGSKPEEFH